MSPEEKAQEEIAQDAVISDDGIDLSAAIGDEGLVIGDEGLVLGDEGAAISDGGPVISDAGMVSDQPVIQIGPSGIESAPGKMTVVQGGGSVMSAQSDNSVMSARFASLGQPSAPQQQGSMDLLLDVNLHLSVELGRASMPVRDVLHLGPGSIVELDKLAGEPVDIMVNGKLVAKGEVVVIDENFGVRVTEIASQSERLSKVV